jgi:Xaa-Pro aminopeptidase
VRASRRGFVRAVVPELRAVRTLTNFHSGSRTIFPSNPAAYPLTRSINTLKIDAGCLLFDQSGYMLGCSDVARTLCLTDEAKELYTKLQHIVRDDLVNACSSGRRGGEIHTKAVNALWQSQDQQQSALFVQPSSPSTYYSRDVGHLLGKNNLSHLTFTGTAAGTLRSGMIACCELQWPIGQAAVAYEDTCIVSSNAGLNITAL